MTDRTPLPHRALPRRALLGGVSGLGALALAANARAQTGRPGLIGAKDIAEAGFIFGLPIVMNYAVMYQFIIDRSSSQWKAPFNGLYNDAHVFTPADTAVPTPNSDTPYSMAWLDLRAEPMVVSIPAVDPKRYLSAQIIDASTYNIGYLGSRTTGSAAVSAVIAGPGWQGTAPAGMKLVRSASQFVFVIFRTQLFDAADMPNVQAVQAGFKVRPLSAVTGAAAPPPAPAISWPRIDDELAKKHFFEYLDFALQFITAQPNEADIRAQLARIGVGGSPGANAGGSSLIDRLEIDVGLYEGNRAVEDAVANAGVGINGWRATEIPGSPEAYDGDWKLRAVAAKAGIYGNSTEEAAYPFTRTDVAGNSIDCTSKAYTITFPADALPPVNAFWSVTMYDGKNQLLVANPINRYLINAPMLPNLKRNADGSLTLYIQHSSPGAERESNWLPAPAGPVYLVMRLYWPKTEQPSLLPIGKGQWKPPAVKPA